VIEADDARTTATAHFNFYDEHGVLLHAVAKQRDLRAER
jgi:hypothetical protein